VTAVVARLRSVVKRFGSVTALEGADLEVRAGEVHGVLGENGAGKSTLLGVLGGMVRPDSGTLELSGRPVELGGPRAAWRHGIGLVHQHFTLVPRLSVLENLALGRPRGVSGLALPLARVQAQAERLMDRTGLRVPLDVRVESIGVGDRQRIEILKALLREPPILVLDEPTAVLTPAEVGSLFELLRALVKEGGAIVLVAHKIDEMLGVADRITVLRRGRTVMARVRAEVDAQSLVRAMVGGSGGATDDASVGLAEGASTGPLHGPTERGGGRPTERDHVARLIDVSARNDSGRQALHGASLSVSRREVVGIAGVEGNGQHELALLLTGRRAPSEGKVELPSGIGFIPQDRTSEGVVPGFDLVENVALAFHDQRMSGGGPWMRWGRVRELAADIVERFGVLTPGVDARAGALSGGNQQRLVVGRELGRATDLLVAENPTRGLDVAATAFVHDEMRRLAASPSGPGVVLLSTDLDEVLALSTRVLVISRGRLIEVPEDRRTREGVGALMLGGRGDA